MPPMRALVRRPSSHLADGIVTHIDRSPIDRDLAFVQWEGYVRALQDAGWDTVEVPPADDFPDSAFVEDTMVVFGRTAVIARSGAPSRRAEPVEAARTIEGLGYALAAIEAPGTLDGGDVLKVGDTVYVGNGGRTNEDGIEQLRQILEPLGATVVAVPLTKVLHLKSAVTALPDGTIIGYAPLVDDVATFPMFLAVPEESGSHVVLLGGRALLMSDDCPLTAAMITAMGYEVRTVAISEFIKLEGCVTCLSVRLREPVP